MTTTEQFDDERWFNLQKSTIPSAFPSCADASADSSQPMEMTPIDPVFSIVYEQMRSDVEQTCNILSIAQGML